MKTSDQGPNFEEDIFPAELAEINKRRRTLNLGDAKFSPKPSVKNGLIGLALSGGGIRSATFSLGVIQALISKKIFKFIDYLSTVSGGGYIGSCISSALNSRGAHESQFENRLGDEDPPAVKHLRNSGNYLSPGGLVDKMRLPTILLRGILLNLFLIVPTLILAVFVTEVLSELFHNIEYKRFRPIVIITPFVLTVIVFSFITKAFRNKFTWNKRNRYERFLAKLFALTTLVLCLVPTLLLVRFCVDATWAGSIKRIFALSELGLSSLKVIIFMTAIGLFFLIVKKFQSLSKITVKIATMAGGILGPLLIFSIYLIFCVFFIESPYFDINYRQELDILSTNTLELKLQRNELKLVDPSKSDNDISKSSFTTSPKNEKSMYNQKRLIKLFVGKGLLNIKKGYKLNIKKCENAPVKWKVVYSKNDSDMENCYCQKPSGNITSKGLNGSCFIVQETENYLFIPKLSIFEAFRDINFSRNWQYIKAIGQSLADRMSWKFYLSGIFIFFFNLFFVNVNITSPHGFYRDRLSKAYLFRTARGQKVDLNDNQKLSELNQEGSVAPYHLINASLNIPGSDDPNLRGRNSDFFTFSKHYSGSDHTGYCATGNLEAVNPHINLGTAMAISGAAAAPNMGTMTLKQFVFVLTLLNVRLSFWIPNPFKINTTGLKAKKIMPNVGPRYLLKEALGSLNAEGTFVNVSDGGHIENLGVYQLLKRRCKLIIASDAEADPEMIFNGLVTLIRYAEIDMGVTIEINLKKIRGGQAHWVLGKIYYGARQDPTNPTECGYLLYIKSSLTGDESEYIKAYKRNNATFPDETTADQFFDETQFECYRSLGEHIAAEMLAGIAKHEEKEYREISNLLKIAKESGSTVSGQTTE